MLVHRAVEHLARWRGAQVGVEAAKRFVCGVCCDTYSDSLRCVTGNWRWPCDSVPQPGTRPTKRGAEVIFLCRRQPGDLIGLLENEFVVLALPEQVLVSCQGLKGRDLYEAWLGCRQDQDAAECIQVLFEAGITSASWLIADHYGIDAAGKISSLRVCKAPIQLSNCL